MTVTRNQLDTARDAAESCLAHIFNSWVKFAGPIGLKLTDSEFKELAESVEGTAERLLREFDAAFYGNPQDLIEIASARNPKASEEYVTFHEVARRSLANFSCTLMQVTLWDSPTDGNFTRARAEVRGFRLDHTPIQAGIRDEWRLAVAAIPEMSRERPPAEWCKVFDFSGRHA